MGYTHYWHIKEGIKELSKACLKDIRKVTEKYKDIIQFESDDKKPIIIESGLIRFNGIEKDGHETFRFVLKKDKGDFIQKDDDGFVFDFCKTAEKPYDIVVCEILLILKAHLQEDIKLSSDGFSNRECSFDGEWSKAIEEVKELGYKINCKVFSRDKGKSSYYDCEIISIESGGSYYCGEWKSN